MRILLFIILNLAALVTEAGQTFTSVLLKDAGQMYLSSESDCGRYKIEAASAEVTENLSKLNHGDALTASGDLDRITCQAFIKAIDYVGLKRLLGYWHTEVGIITVKDYNTMMIYPRTGSLPGSKEVSQEIPDPIYYRYTVLPSLGKEWVVFLSDATSTTFATLTFHRSTATLKTFDADSGIMTREVHMIRWKELQ